MTFLQAGVESDFITIPIAIPIAIAIAMVMVIHLSAVELRAKLAVKV